MPAFPLSTPTAPPTHDTDHEDMLKEVTTLHPQARAVMFVVEPDPESDEGGLRYVLHSFGVEGDWDKILGVLAAGQAYVTTSMFSTPPGVEEMSGATDFSDDDDEEDGDEPAANALGDETGA